MKGARVKPKSCNWFIVFSSSQWSLRVVYFNKKGWKEQFRTFLWSFFQHENISFCRKIRYKQSSKWLVCSCSGRNKFVLLIFLRFPIVIVAAEMQLKCYTRRYNPVLCVHLGNKSIVNVQAMPTPMYWSSCNYFVVMITFLKFVGVLWCF